MDLLLFAYRVWSNLEALDKLNLFGEIMIARHRDRRKEWVRNLFLVILAIAVVVIFFNLDIMRQGESLFSKSADKKLEFGGDLKRSDYTKEEISKLIRYTKKYNDIFGKVFIETSRQDSYKKISPKSKILFEVHIRMIDGTTISTPLRRSLRKELVSAILVKLEKDVGAYMDIQEKGKKIKSLVNTM